jgi:hypothetical protein
MIFQLIGASNKRHAQFPMARHNNVDPTRVLSLAIVTLGIVWDSDVTRRLAIVTLIIAIVCFSLVLFFYLHRR